MKNKIIQTLQKVRERIFFTENERILMRIGAVTVLELNNNPKFKSKIKGTTYSQRLKKLITF